MKFKAFGIMLVILSLGVFNLSAQSGTTFRIGGGNGPGTFDPHGPYGSGSLRFLYWVYDSLLFKDGDGNLQPNLATDYSISEDGLQITMNLRDDVVFSDGSPFTADDVVFTFERAQQIGQQSNIFGTAMTMQRIEAVDDYTVVFTLRAPSADVLTMLGVPGAAIVSRSAVEAAGEDYRANPVGTGPFVLADWEPGERVRLEVNPNYGGHRSWEAGDYSGFDAVEFSIIEDQSVMSNALLAGELDLAVLTVASQVERFRDNPDFTVLTYPLDGLFYLGFNTRSELFSQIEARSAVTQAVDAELVRTIIGEFNPARMPLPSTMSVYDPALDDEAIQFNFDAAVEQLAEVGISSSDRQMVSLVTVPTGAAAAAIVQQQLAPLGLDVEIEVEGFGTVMRRSAMGDYDMLIFGYFLNDPHDLSTVFGTGGFINMVGYSNPELDALLTAGRSVYDVSERTEAYTAAQRFIMDEALLLPLWESSGTLVFSNAVQGYQQAGNVTDISGLTFVN